MWIGDMQFFCRFCNIAFLYDHQEVFQNPNKIACLLLHFFLFKPIYHHFIIFTTSLSGNKLVVKSGYLVELNLNYTVYYYLV